MRSIGEERKRSSGVRRNDRKVVGACLAETTSES